MKKKIILTSTIGVIIMLICSISISIAWFDQSSNLAVNTIDISFSGEKRLLISTKDYDFKPEVDPSDLGEIPTFVPVSSMYTSEYYKTKPETFKFKAGYTKGNIKLEHTYKEPADALDGFFTTDLWLLSPDDDVIVTLAPPLGGQYHHLFTPNTDANMQKAKQLEHGEENIQKAYESLNQITKSLRLSIIDKGDDYYNHWIIEQNKPSKPTYFAGPLAFNTRTYDYYVDETGNPNDFIFGEYTNEDKMIFVDKPNDDDYYYQSNDYIHTPNIFYNESVEGSKTLSFASSLKNGWTPKIEESISNRQCDDLLHIPVYKNVPKKISIAVYLEGWDRDNTENVMFGSFDANISFKILREMK